jgi:hypothetical protein
VLPDQDAADEAAANVGGTDVEDPSGNRLLLVAA